MTNSILTSTKKLLNLPEDYDEFDQVILMNINAVFSDLEQLGIGPPGGYMIEDESANWDDYLSNDYRLNNVKMLMYFKVRMAFDPPDTSYHINAIQEQIKELTFRINLTREEEEWTDPRPDKLPVDELPYQTY